MSDGRHEVSIAFYIAEAKLYRAGVLAYFRMLRLTARNQLYKAGAFGPFSFTIVGGDGNVSPLQFKMWEKF